MGTILDKPSILERIKMKYALKSNADLARFLGVAPNTITNWYSRKTFDIDLIYTKCVDVDWNWLFTGKDYTSKLNQSAIQEQNVDNLTSYKIYKDMEAKADRLLKENALLEDKVRQLEAGSDLKEKFASIASTGNKSKKDSGVSSRTSARSDRSETKSKGL